LIYYEIEEFIFEEVAGCMETETIMMCHLKSECSGYEAAVRRYAFAGEKFRRRIDVDVLLSKKLMRNNYSRLVLKELGGRSEGL